ncbi:ATPase E1-E2 type family protein / haloaciddehalogenase-like hydrolase family protein [Striga asiatica]|uniref:ATPase E1-E2 type family protein / haloaciddehalogenase-like hydrolase family protein n=1 Tax=Striga asiatica TaxID=4170 RepID=A0A5A7QWG5_STRAF|nr:ATPase E1-E2 type family protein / haloaciddehalogenase-like hydrolase family protein [Striga asiatica]
MFSFSPAAFSFSAPLPLGFSFSDPLPLAFSFSAPHTFSDRSSDFFSALNCRMALRMVIWSASLQILWNICFFSGSAFLLFFDFLVTVDSVPLTSSTALFLVDLALDFFALELFLAFLSDSDSESSSDGAGIMAEGVWGFLAAAGGGEVFRICSGSDPISSDEEFSVSSSPEEETGSRAFAILRRQNESEWRSSGVNTPKI